MWYSKYANKTISGRLISEFGRSLYGYIYRNSETAPEDEIHIWFNPKEMRWLVSMGDWSETSCEIVDDAINSIAEEFHKCLGIEYKKPEIEHEAEIGHPGGDWILMTHDFGAI